MVAFLDRVVLVWEPQLKSIILDSLNSKPPSSVNIGRGCYLERSATAHTIFHRDGEVIILKVVDVEIDSLVEVYINFLYCFVVAKSSVIIRGNTLVNLINTHATDFHFLDGRVYFNNSIRLIIGIEELRCRTKTNLIDVD